ncbi:nuclease-related domain-containing protein [Pseudomonas typographi]|uniref:nuclease-related domain-containing protein n=1 Tax=Pseudomonas typographi TaxID=2715964 RepID=UPI001684DC1B|nr:NERD domain-containing protein [Pseudomonas typographi]
MDVWHLFPSLFPAWTWVGLLVLTMASALLGTPMAKGWLGEAWVKLLARIALKPAVYRRLHNVTLPTPGGTTQVDHVFVSRFGVFVVETKNLRGWIFGGERQAEWTQKLYRHSRRFQNPLRQNYKHTEALQAALGLPRDQVHSVVAFVGPSTFKTPMPAHVTQGGGFVRYIRQFRQVVFSEAEVNALVLALSSARLAPTLATQRAHVQGLKARFAPPSNGARRMGRGAMARGSVACAVVVIGAAAACAWAYGPKPLATQLVETTQPVAVKAGPVNRATLEVLAGTQGPLADGARRTLARQAHTEAVAQRGSRRSLQACIKAGNLIDDDVNECMQGLRVRDW